MIMGEMWWKRMVNSVRFLEDVQYFIDSGKSVILNFPYAVPFLDVMADEISMRVSQNDKNFEVHDVGEPIKLDGETTERIANSGEYILHKFCPKSIRVRYLPTVHISRERYVASCKDTPLHTLVVCAVGIDPHNAQSWIKSVNEYTENCTTEEHGIFILVTHDANVRSSGCVECLQFSDYITDYDCMMLCLTMISSLPYSRIQKLYLSEVASNIANNNVENAGLLVSAEADLIREPIETTKKIFEENNIKCTRLEEQVNDGVWEAQIRLVFPRIEDYRSKIVKKYETKIQKYLPITNSINERIDKANDVEIAQLYTLCSSKGIADRSECKLLEKMRKARNDLAHHNPLTFKQIMDLGIF